MVLPSLFFFTSALTSTQQVNTFISITVPGKATCLVMNENFQLTLSPLNAVTCWLVLASTPPGFLSLSRMNESLTTHHLFANEYFCCCCSSSESGGKLFAAFLCNQERKCKCEKLSVKRSSPVFSWLSEWMDQRMKIINECE